MNSRKIHIVRTAVIIKPISFSRHRDFLENIPLIPVFYTPRWHMLMQAYYHEKSQVWGIFDGAALQGFIPVTRLKLGKTLLQGIVSQPWGAWGGLFPRNKDALSDALVQYMKSLSGIDICILHDNPLQPANDDKVPKEENDTFIIDLCPDKEKLWQSFSSRKRNDIRRAEKKGVHVELDSAEDGPALAWDMYSKSLDSRGKEGAKYDKAFFHNCFSCLGQDVEFYTASYKNRIIAGSLFYKGKNIIHYAFAFGEREYYHLNAHSLIIWKVCSEYAGRMQCFDLGASQHIASLEKFKAAFGTKKYGLAKRYVPLNMKGNIYTKIKQIRERTE